MVAIAICVLTASFAHAQEIAIPDENARDRREAPPRPAAGDADARAAVLFRAIQEDNPELARDFFFPREPFLVLKGIADPGRYWGILYGHYERDIHEMHGSLPQLEGASFARFVLSRRGEWVERRQEANALPYWAARHNFVYYTNGEREHRFEIRTLINWGPRWFVTHLR
jgi:hypothetical protein